MTIPAPCRTDWHRKRCCGTGKKPVARTVKVTEAVDGAGVQTSTCTIAIEHGVNIATVLPALIIGEGKRYHVERLTGVGAVTKNVRYLSKRSIKGGTGDNLKGDRLRR